MSDSTPKSTPDVLSTVELLRSFKMMPLPISLNSKVTYCKNFTDPGFVSPYNDWQNQNLGVGIVLSTKYKMVDIDIDDPRITDLCMLHLPKGGWIYGRKSKKRSHHVFLMANVTDTTQVEAATDPKQKGYMDTEKVMGVGINGQPRPTIIEFRGHGSQSVMPGTLHEASGELIEWDSGRAPTSLPAAVQSRDLRVAVRKIAITAMVADYAWKEGLRHDVTLCLSSMMHASKWTLEEAEQWFSHLMTWTKQGERKNVMTCVRDTYKAADNKKRLQGGPRLAEITGCKQLVTEFRRLFMDIREQVLEDMNSRYALGVYFGKVCVFDFEVIDDVTVPDFETLSTADFELLGSNERVKVPGKKGDTYVTKSKFWLAHPNRRTCRITDFMPGQKSEVDGKLNLWRGWGVKADPTGSIDAWLHHMDTYICSGDQDLKHWLMAWLADVVQNPGSKPGTALMMRSGQRSGKNTFVEMMKRVIGIRYFREMNSSGQITNRFNSHFQYALMVMANEADFASSSAAINVLKTLITDSDFHMDHKHGHAKTGKNYTRVVLSSNKIHVIDRDRDDQRYTVVDVLNPAEVLEDEVRIEHFDRIYAEIDGRGPGKLLDYLMRYEYDRDMLRNCYQSDAGRAQTLMSMNPVAQWWAMCLSDGRIQLPDAYTTRAEYQGDGVFGWPTTIGKAAIEAAFRDQVASSTKISAGAFFATFYDCSGLNSEDTRQVGSRGGRYRALVLPSIDECRAKMNEIFPGVCEAGTQVEELLQMPIERTDEDEF